MVDISFFKNAAVALSYRPWRGIIPCQLLIITMFSYASAEQKQSVLATGLVLFAANLLPLIAVWKLEWKLYDLLVLYWVEVIIIGLINVGRMVLIKPSDSKLTYHLLKAAFIPFFICHFGCFCVGIGIAMQFVFGKENFTAGEQINGMLYKDGGKMFWPLVIAHIYPFFWNYLRHREYGKTRTRRRMIMPYLRVLPTLIIVFAGGFWLIKSDLPSWGLYVLISLKAVVDWILHSVLHLRLMCYDIITTHLRKPEITPELVG